jgi:hypothetical protein
MTRYEFAEALAKALAYAEQNETLAEDVEILSKLSVEFADELASLGVDVADLQAAVGANSEAVAAMQELVDKHEKFFEPVTISGEIEFEYEKVVLPTVEPGEISDTVELTLEAEINDTTTASITLEGEDLISGTGDIVVDDWWLKHFGEDLSLWAGEVEPATIGQGLIYDFDTNEEFYGAWAQWMWDTDEDLGTWTAFFDAADFYLVNIAFDLGDDDDIPTSITASYDDAAGGFVAGAELTFNLNDEDEDDIMLGLEAAVFTDLTTTSFGAAGSLSGTLGDDDDVEADLTLWYTQPGFAPSNSDFDPDELGIELEATFTLVEDDEDEDDILGEVIASPRVGYVMDSAFTAATDTYVGLELEFPKLDSDNPDCGGCIDAEYSLVDGSLELEGTLENVVLSEYDDGSDELVMNFHANYNVDVVNDYDGLVNLIYNFDDEDLQLLGEVRLDSDGAAFYSAEAQLVYEAAENTELKVGVEMNDWEDDINDWDDNNILDDKTKIYAGVEVSF